MSKTIYLTTPLYYVNAAPHIGHSYTNIAADCVARYSGLKGMEVFLLTGTDEHGQKIAQAAAAAGKSPQAFVDEIVPTFQALWELLNIRYDDFIRTTQPRHTEAVQRVLVKLRDDGVLTRRAYQGWYCTPDETFWTEAELAAAPGSGPPACPTCQRGLEPVKEEGWHLPLRAHQAWLAAFLAAHPHFVQPASRHNELLGLLQQPLPESLCITRPKRRVPWGIPVPFDPDHVVYVWFDALLNYITVPGYPSSPRFASLWPANIHFIGKDILRHHAVYWPIMLHALGFSDEQMPGSIWTHGWWKIGEQKMSKSLGNIVNPVVVITELLKGQPYAADVYRYFLLREIPFGQDGNFSEGALTKRLSADLANDLGNLVNRTCSMIARYQEGRIPGVLPIDKLDVAPPAPVNVRPAKPAQPQRVLAEQAVALAQRIPAAMDGCEFSIALEAIMHVIAEANRFVEETAPWKLAKNPAEGESLKRVLGTLAEVVRISTVWLEPFMPAVAAAVQGYLGLPTGEGWASAESAAWGYEEGRVMGPHPVLFPKPAAQDA